VLLHLSLCVFNDIQLTLSQSTYDVIQQENDVSRCGRTEQVLHQLVTAVSQLQTAVSQIQERLGIEVKRTLLECIIAV